MPPAGLVALSPGAAAVNAAGQTPNGSEGTDWVTEGGITYARPDIAARMEGAATGGGGSSSPMTATPTPTTSGAPMSSGATVSSPASSASSSSSSGIASAGSAAMPQSLAALNSASTQAPDRPDYQAQSMIGFRTPPSLATLLKPRIY